MRRSTGAFLLGALFGGATALLLLGWLRHRGGAPPAPPYARPRGGERDGEHELFIGS